jgi:ribosomal protein L40E
MDDFFKKKVCDRCGAKLKYRIMSMYNTDVICRECKDKEQQREDYSKALEADHEQIRKGNYNFKGIGLTPNNDNN